MIVQKLLAIWAGKAAIFLGKLLGKKGSSSPGSIALKLYPRILSDLAGQVQHEIVVICGTNGKTTTSNLLDSLIKSTGKKVVCNNVGANMLPGVTCAFIDHVGWFGKLDADYAVIECDEASLKRVVDYMTPDKIVLTNLFRDQLDRYGEIDITIRLLSEAFDKLDSVSLIVNGDDPLCSYFGTKYPAIYYGVDQKYNIQRNEMKEGRFCLVCGNELSYHYYHYSQLGDYYCEACGFKRPDLSYAADNIDLTGGMAFDIHHAKGVTPLRVNYKGFYNIYNILAAFSAFSELGFDTANVNAVFDAYKPQIGRMESFVLNTKNVVLNLSKNPAGFNQAIATLLSDPSQKDVFVVINDNAQDGKDISWIWDVEFEQLKNANIHSLFAGGIRKDDLALRLKYGGLKNIRIMENNYENLKSVVMHSKRPLYLLVNYTALFSTQDNLKRLRKELGQ